MKRFGTTTRIAFAMAMWTATVLLCLRIFGVLDDGFEQRIEARTRLAETVAVNCSQFASRGDLRAINVALESLVRRHPDLQSAACHFTDDTPLIAVGDHAQYWQHAGGDDRSNCIAVPVLRGASTWAEVQLCFTPPVTQAWYGMFAMPSVQITLLATLANLLGFSILLRRCFHHLDPSRAIPERVRAALDTLVEGVVVLDKNQRINLANQSFAKLLGRDPDDFQGQHLDDLPWQVNGGRTLAGVIDTLADGDEARRACQIDLDKVKLAVGGRVRTLKPNASRIEDATGACQGYLLSLDDITSLEEKTEQLQYLATRDSLTGCLNRRAFFEQVTTAWASANRYDHPISVMMVDIDHFKSVNDTYGHAVGDEVLRAVASTLLQTARDTDRVCRFGGEEFCVLLPHVDLAGAKQAGERYRIAIETLEFEKLSVTASLGCSAMELGATDFDAMQEQADQCLYHAKRHGRNQTVGFDQVLAEQSGTATPTITATPQKQPALSPEKALLRSLQQLMSDVRDQGRSDFRVDELNAAIARV